MALHALDNYGKYSAGKNPVIFVVAGTLLVVFVAFVGFFVFYKKNKLNWYEKNLLEISQDKKIIRYKNSFPENGEEDEHLPLYSKKPGAFKKKGLYRTNMGKADSIDSESTMSSRKQSRIYCSLPSLDAVSMTSVVVESARSEIKENRFGQLDVSDKFYVPKQRIATCSMFRGLDKNKIDKELYDSTRQDSVPTEEQILGQCGSIQMGMSFDATLNLLTVKLIQASNLTANRSDASPNPYFKVNLIPPEPTSHTQSYQSKLYKNQRSPDLGDEFCFDVSVGSISQYKLEMVVYDFDQYSVDECIGCCWLSMNRIDLPCDPALQTVFWAEIMPTDSNNEDSAGDVLFSIAYLSKAQRLIVTVLKARNLLAHDENIHEPPDPCIKITAFCKSKRLKQKRTAAKKATYNPTYNEALTFNIPKNSLCDIVLNICVCHEPHTFRSSKVIGKVELPLHKCKDLWRAVIKGEDSKAKWYQLEKP